MLDSIFCCCTKRDKPNFVQGKKRKSKKKDIKAPSPRRQSGIDLFGKIDWQVREEVRGVETSFQALLGRIRDGVINSSIPLSVLEEILSDDSDLTIEKTGLMKVFRLDYFCYESGEILDARKVMMVLVVYSGESREEMEECFLEYVDEILEDEDTPLIYSSNSPSLLLCLEYLLTSSILPIVQHPLTQKSSLTESQKLLIKYATVKNQKFPKSQKITENYEIYEKFTKEISSKFLFPQKGKKHRKSVKLDREEFRTKIHENSDLLFDPVKVRRMFLAFCESYEEEGNSVSNRRRKGSKRDRSKRNKQSIEMVENNYLLSPNQDHNITPEKRKEDQGIPIQISEFSPNFAAGRNLDSSIELHEGMVSRDSHLIPTTGTEIFQPLDSGFNPFAEADPEEMRLRMDDSVNIGRKTNLSADLNKSSLIYEEPGYDQSLEEKYGPDLIALLKTQFEDLVIEENYSCEEQNCTIPFIAAEVSKLKGMEGASRVSHPSETGRLSHSFRISASSLSERNLSNLNAEEYLKAVIKAKLSLLEFSRFYYFESNNEGVLNSYLRLLDVYKEFQFEKAEYGYPCQNVSPVKIFETDLFIEYNRECQSGEISESLQEELQDLLDYSQLIVPIYVGDSPLIFIVDLDRDVPVITLLHLENQISDKDEDTQGELSETILDILERAYSANNREFDTENCEGDRIGVGSMPQMLDRVESIVLQYEGGQEEITEKEIKHKIVDRLLSVHLL